MIAVVAIIVGLLLALLSGGQLARLSSATLRFEWVLLALFVIQGAARGRLWGLTAAQTYGTAVWIVASVGVLIVLALNLAQPGVALAAAGVLANLDVVLLNGAMPVSPEAVLSLTSRSVSSTMAASNGFYELAGSGTMLGWLGDTMPLRVFSMGQILSLGDVMLAVGVAVFIFSSCLPCDEMGVARP